MRHLTRKVVFALLPIALCCCTQNSTTENTPTTTSYRGANMPHFDYNWPKGAKVAVAYLGNYASFKHFKTSEYYEDIKEKFNVISYFNSFDVVTQGCSVILVIPAEEYFNTNIAYRPRNRQHGCLNTRWPTLLFGDFEDFSIILTDTDKDRPDYELRYDLNFSYDKPGFVTPLGVIDLTPTSIRRYALQKAQEEREFKEKQLQEWMDAERKDTTKFFAYTYGIEDPIVIKDEPNGITLDTLPDKYAYIFSLSGFGRNNGWWKIAGPIEACDSERRGVEDFKPDVEAWISGRLVKLISKNLTGKLVLRADTDEKEEPTFEKELYYDTRVEFHPLQREGNWIEVETLDGQNSGWIKMNELEGDIFLD